jgi:transcriptional regulator with XRE-family HTH domain
MAGKNVLVAYRAQHKLSQQELADKLGVSRQLVGLIENGDRLISAKNANAWEGILGVSRDELCPEVFKRARPQSVQPA